MYGRLTPVAWCKSHSAPGEAGAESRAAFRLHDLDTGTKQTRPPSALQVYAKHYKSVIDPEAADAGNLSSFPLLRKAQRIQNLLPGLKNTGTDLEELTSKVRSGDESLDEALQAIRFKVRKPAGVVAPLGRIKAWAARCQCCQTTASPRWYGIWVSKEGSVQQVIDGEMAVDGVSSKTDARSRLWPNGMTRPRRAEAIDIGSDENEPDSTSAFVCQRCHNQFIYEGRCDPPSDLQDAMEPIADDPVAEEGKAMPTNETVETPAPIQSSAPVAIPSDSHVSTMETKHGANVNNHVSTMESNHGANVVDPVYDAPMEVDAAPDAHQSPLPIYLQESQPGASSPLFTNVPLAADVDVSVGGDSPASTSGLASASKGLSSLTSAFAAGNERPMADGSVDVPSIARHRQLSGGPNPDEPIELSESDPVLAMKAPEEPLRDAGSASSSPRSSAFGLELPPNANLDSERLSEQGTNRHSLLSTPMLAPPSPGRPTLPSPAQSVIDFDQRGPAPPMQSLAPASPLRATPPLPAESSSSSLQEISAQALAPSVSAPPSPPSPAGADIPSHREFPAHRGHFAPSPPARPATRPPAGYFSDCTPNLHAPARDSARVYYIYDLWGEMVARIWERDSYRSRSLTDYPRADYYYAPDGSIYNRYGGKIARVSDQGGYYRIEPRDYNPYAPYERDGFIYDSYGYILGRASEQRSIY